MMVTTPSNHTTTTSGGGQIYSTEDQIVSEKTRKQYNQQNLGGTDHIALGNLHNEQLDCQMPDIASFKSAVVPSSDKEKNPPIKITNDIFKAKTNFPTPFSPL